MNRKLLFSIITSFFIITCYSQKSIWIETSMEQLANLPKSERETLPLKYKLFNLNFTALKKQLQFAPTRTSGLFSTVIVPFPNPDGTIGNFRVYEASVMQQDLAARYPDCKSYVGKGIEDPTATIRFSTTLFGLHTMTRSGNTGTQYIDTFTKDLSNYIVYNKIDLHTIKERACLVDENFQNEVLQQNSIKSSLVSDGLFRTYRLAMACTIEYAAFHVNAAGVSGGTIAQKKAAVLAAMNVSMTRINGVFEIDMSLTMQLIANNDLIIFIDSDSFDNANAGNLINQSQTVIDAAIGLANYDIGHTVSTGGGGLAQLYSPCSSSKAKGITGSGAPVGDPFDIDYVAHEMGHQFGGNHTQNNDCNRNNSTAVEPGSASTIMGYAGICAPDVQSNSDDHFHTVNLSEMTSFVTGAGNCSASVANGDTAPIANAGLDYTIPNGTAFILKGIASDIDGDALTYCWEQTDTEVSTQPPTQDALFGPNFRSNSPITSNERYMPTIQSVIDNNLAPTWEVISNVARTMNFAFTVRDNAAPNGGQTTRDNMVVTTSSVGPFLVNLPNTALSWVAGSNQTVTWTVAGTTTNGINAMYVDVLLSIDGGYTYPIILASKVPNDGSEIITVPNNPGGQNRIMVRGYHHIFYDISNTNFIITAPSSNFSVAFSGIEDQQNKAACQGFNVSYAINYQALAGFSGTTTFSASGNPSGSIVSFLPASINSSGTVLMTITNTSASTAGFYTILVTATFGTTTKTVPFYFELFDAVFPAMSLLTPSNNAVGQSNNLLLTWSTNSNAVSYDVQVASNPSFTNIVSFGNVTTTSYNLSGLLINTDYYWRIMPRNNYCSDNYSSSFTFKTGLIACASPSSTNVPIVITSVGTPTISSTIVISSGGSITDVNVNAQLSHSWIDDLSATLTSPNGTVVQLFSGLCGSNDNLNATFDDSGVVIVCGSNPAITGVVLPLQALSAFNGENPTGTWILSISDSADQDGGSLTSWGLSICATQLLDVADATMQDFSLYPNPTAGNFTISFTSSSSDPVKVSVYDMRGREIFESLYKNSGVFSENINLEGVQTGVYLVAITSGDKKIVKRIIVK
ncbi:reprolysin-like metallopeptidase [Flavobacterium sp.]|uniref:reprolysin-like metallopeptidase n=1 Tax=Flavobacterium sp. TaxID=239 RepID=UPI003750E693